MTARLWSTRRKSVWRLSAPGATPSVGEIVDLALMVATVTLDARQHAIPQAQRIVIEPSLMRQ
jgi:hypothetical protein